MQSRLVIYKQYSEFSENPSTSALILNILTLWRRQTIFTEQLCTEQSTRQQVTQTMQLNLLTPPFCFRNIYNAEKDSVSSSESNPEDHIYEEIDSDYFATKEEEVEDNFLLSISLERQRNLRFYGSAGWDFGNVC